MVFAPVLDTLLDLDLVLVTGKGGVGKTFVAAALAHEAARVGARPLVVSLGPKVPLEMLLEVPLRPEPSPGSLGVEAVVLTPEAVIPAALARALHTERLARAIYEHRALRTFFDAAPAAFELAAWVALDAYVSARDQAGHHRHHPVIVDMDATGHAAMMLEVPRLLRPFTTGGPIRGLVETARRRLAAPGTGVCLVAAPAPVPAEEALDLYDTLVGDLEILVAALVINGLPADPLAGVPDPDLSALEVDARRRGDRETLRDAAFARRISKRARAMAEAAAELARATEAPACTIPWFPDPIGRNALAEAGAALGAVPDPEVHP